MKSQLRQMLTVTLAVIYTNVPVEAQTSEGASDAGLDEIVVTAQRRTQNINDVGMAITALSDAQLAEQRINDVGDLARVVPGFSYAESQKGSPIYTIRGVGYYEESLAASPAVTVYGDEIAYPFPIMAKGATLDVERVEVLKGPQGTLYGENSTGGAVNYVAAKPTTTFTGSGEVGGGSYGASEGAGTLSGPLADTLLGRVAFDVREGGDWQHSYTRDATNGGQNLIRGRGILEWTPADKLSVALTLSGFRDRSDTAAAALYRVTPQIPVFAQPSVLAQTPAPLQPGVADWDPGKPLTTDENYYQAALRVKYEISDRMTLNSSTAYHHFTQNDYRDLDGSALNVFSVQQVGKINSFFQELRLGGDLPQGAANWLVGASYASDRTAESNESFVVNTTSAHAFGPFGIAPFAAAIAADTQDTTTKAVFANLEFKFTDSLSNVTGVRYTNSRTTYSGCTEDVDGNLAAGLNLVEGLLKSHLPGNPPVIPIPQGSCITLNSQTFDPGLFNDVLQESNVSWREGLNFKPSHATLLYATVSRGYKSGNFPNINATSSIALAPVTQESVIAYEAGVKWDIGRLAHLDASVFDYDYTNKQIRGRILDPSGVFGAVESLVNVPKSRAAGVDSSLTVSPLTGLTFTVGGLYLETKVTDSFLNYDPFGTPVNFKDEAFPFSPKWSGDAGVEYKAAFTAHLSGFVGGNTNYQSRTVSAFGDSPLFNIEPYALVDAHLGVESDAGWRLSFWARNLMDKYYWTDTFREIDNTSRHVGPGRTFGASLSGRF
jgi:iron complex outermembrane recepter protein